MINQDSNEDVVATSMVNQEKQIYSSSIKGTQIANHGYSNQEARQQLFCVQN